MIEIERCTYKTIAEAVSKIKQPQNYDVEITIHPNGMVDLKQILDLSDGQDLMSNL